MSKTRTARNLTYESIRASMRDLGYDPLRPIFLDRWMRYRLIVVAVNHLATILNRDPYRVYQALLCRAERTVRGKPFMPNRQTQLDPEGQREGERRGGLHVYCPCCGTDLIECGKVTKEEVLNEVNHRRSPHNFPQSSVEKSIRDVVETGSGDVSGAGGAGGSGPAGGCRNVIEPHPPELEKTDL